MQVEVSAPDEFSQFLREQINTWGVVIREADIKPE
jgi:hypothetical protein